MNLRALTALRERYEAESSPSDAGTVLQSVHRIRDGYTVVPQRGRTREENLSRRGHVKYFRENVEENVFSTVIAAPIYAGNTRLQPNANDVSETESFLTDAQRNELAFQQLFDNGTEEFHDIEKGGLKERYRVRLSKMKCESKKETEGEDRRKICSEKEKATQEKMADLQAMSVLSMYQDNISQDMNTDRSWFGYQNMDMQSTDSGYDHAATSALHVVNHPKFCRDNGSEASTREAGDYGSGDHKPTCATNSNGKSTPPNHCSIIMGGLLNNRSLVFNDGVRSVDYVLVWESLKENANTPEAIEERRVFEENLEQEGLQLEREAPDNLYGLHFVKIHTPLTVLRDYSEILKLRMPMKESSKIQKGGRTNAILNAALYMSKFSALKDVHEKTNSVLEKMEDAWNRIMSNFRVDTRIFPERKHRLTAIYSKDKEYLFDTMADCFWTPAIRSRIVQFILDRKKFSSSPSDDFAFGITRLISNNTYSAAYPLHDGNCKTPGSMRYLLLSEWANVSKCLKHQPLDYVKDYFGVKIAACFLELWKRYSAEMTHRWDLTGFDVYEEHPRPQYLARLAHVKRTQLNVVTGEQEPMVPFWRMRLPAALMSFSVVALLVLLAVASVLGVVLYRMSLLGANILQGEDRIPIKFSPIFFTSATAACINLAFIFVFNYPECKAEFEFVTFPGYAALRARQNLSSSRTQGILRSVRGVRDSDPETTPAFGVIDKKRIKSPLQWVKDFKLVDFGHMGLFPEYLEMVLQYGFVTIFVAAFPLAPFFALINNVLEMRLDAKKMLTCYRRPVPQRVNDIGVWYRILDSIGKLSIITNGFIIAFTSDFIPRLVYHFTHNNSLNGYVEHTLTKFDVDVLEHPPLRHGNHQYNGSQCSFPGYWYYKEGDDYTHSDQYWHIMGARLAFVVVFENVVALVMIIVRWAIPDTSAELRDRIRREAYVINTFILEETRARSAAERTPRPGGRSQGLLHSTPI
ncbi:Anoctamin-5 [Eumeta japonica]|uniref:Anoctamin n=1 Tax=Eumeta variegata TaxID=151549 RepID=A0A4C1TWW0_EUMVA|nr:Anoctamin-5 [Eumeta japonica]